MWLENLLERSHFRAPEFLLAEPSNLTHSPVTAIRSNVENWSPGSCKYLLLIKTMWCSTLINLENWWSLGKKMFPGTFFFCLFFFFLIVQSARWFTYIHRLVLFSFFLWIHWDRLKNTIRWGHSVRVRIQTQDCLTSHICSLPPPALSTLVCPQSSEFLSS